MGCGASNNNNNVSAITSNIRSIQTTTATVQRSNTTSQNNNFSVLQQSKPIVEVKNYRHGSDITLSNLMKQRDEFWVTRTEGNRHMWINIRAAAEALVNKDKELANAILKASNIVSTTGIMNELYDERGHVYKLPIYCIANPIELMGEGGGEIDYPGTKSSKHNSSVKQSNIVVATPLNEPISTVQGEPLKLKVRINPGDINLLIDVNSQYSLLQLKNSIVEAATPVPEMSENRQRIIFMGRELKNDNQKLKDVGFDEQKVVQVFLRPK